MDLLVHGVPQVAGKARGGLGPKPPGQNARGQADKGQHQHQPASLGLYYRARQASAPLKALLRILRERDSRPKPRETMGKHRDI